jgi:hypothetical protein
MAVTVAFSNSVSVPTGAWTTLTVMSGPGVFVPILSAPLTGTQTLDVRLLASNPVAASFLIDEPTVDGNGAIPRSGWHGPPYPLPLATWQIDVQVMNNNAAAVTVVIQVLQIS